MSIRAELRKRDTDLQKDVRVLLEKRVCKKRNEKSMNEMKGGHYASFHISRDFGGGRGHN